MGQLPSGIGTFKTMPGALHLPELVFGGLVWILIACTSVVPLNPQGWVMFVSISCFIVTSIWVLVFARKLHRNKAIWVKADLLYHFIATILYISALVSLVNVTLCIGTVSCIQAFKLELVTPDISDLFPKSSSPLDIYNVVYNLFSKLDTSKQDIYKLNLSAVIFSFVATLLYFIHTILAAARWRSF